MDEENRLDPEQPTPKQPAEPDAEQSADTGAVGGILPAIPVQNGALGGKITTRGLAEGAMMTALALILAVISVYVPILAIIAPLLFPVPPALVVLRHGLKLGCLSAVSVFLLSIIMLGLPNAMYLFMQFGFLGLFFGWCFRQRKKASFTLLVGMFISAVAVLLALLFPTVIAGISVEQYQQMLSSTLEGFVGTLQQQGANAEAVLGGMTPAAYVEYMEKSLLLLLPAMFICSAMSLTLLCYALMCKLLRRFGYEVVKLPPFSEWRLDWRLLWALIGALAMAAFGDRLSIDIMTRIGDNLLAGFFPILVVCGISVAVWVLKPWRAPAFAKVVVFGVIWWFFGALALYMLVLIGIFDPIFDFRRRIELQREKRK